MAVDTRNERASVIGYALPAIFVLPNPDGEIAPADWLQLLWLYPGNPVASVVTERGRGKEQLFPERKMVSPLEYRRGWKEHIHAVEQSMLAKSVGVEKARKFEVPKHEPAAPKRKTKGIQTPRREKAARPDPVNRLEANREKVDAARRTARVDRGIQKPPSEKSLPRRAPQPVRRTDSRLEKLRGQSQNPLEKINAQQKRKAIESRVEKGMIAAEKQDRVDAQMAKEAAFKRRKSALVNLEFAKEAQAKKQAVEDARNKQRAKALRKARAAKKRKAKKKK